MRVSTQNTPYRLLFDPALALIAATWFAGAAFLISTASPGPVVVTHWANGHMMDRETLFPTFAREFNEAEIRTPSGKRIEVHVVKANSGEITGELQARIAQGHPLDRTKANPSIVTPAADHWLNDVNEVAGPGVVNPSETRVVATTYIGIVTSREMAECLGWPQKEIGFADVIDLATDPRGWTRYGCARAEWGREALIAYTYPTRSSTARSVLYTLYSISAGKPAESLTIQDVTRPDVAEYVKRFQSAIDCYVPDTLDLNTKILSTPTCAHFFFIAEDNLVKLYQGKVQVPVGERTVARYLERDLVMIYPKEGSIIHNHSAFSVNAPFVSSDQKAAAERWTAFLRENPRQQALMQEGFRPATPLTCTNPLGSPFSQCTNEPKNEIYPDRIDPEVARTILKAWE